MGVLGGGRGTGLSHGDPGGDGCLSRTHTVPPAAGHTSPPAQGPPGDLGGLRLCLLEPERGLMMWEGLALQTL